MKIYKFNGDYKRLKALGYYKINLFKDINLWGMVKPDCSVVVGEYISVKPFDKVGEPAITNPTEVKKYISDLINNNLVIISEAKYER